MLAVKTAVDALEEILDSASQVKSVGVIEPALTPLNLPDIDRKFGANRSEMLESLGFHEHNVVELACRKIFLQILVRSPSPADYTAAELWLDIYEHARPFIRQDLEPARHRQRFW